MRSNELTFRPKLYKSKACERFPLRHVGILYVKYKAYINLNVCILATTQWQKNSRKLYNQPHFLPTFYSHFLLTKNKLPFSFLPTSFSHLFSKHLIPPFFSLFIFVTTSPPWPIVFRFLDAVWNNSMFTSFNFQFFYWLNLFYRLLAYTFLKF